MNFDIARHERDILRNLLKQEIKSKQNKELDKMGEHMLQEKKSLYKKLGGDLDNL